MTVPPVSAELRTLAGWAWRLALLVILTVLAVRALAALRVVVVPLLVAVLLTTQLEPMARRLREAGAPAALAALAAVGGAFAVLAGALALLVPALVSELDDLGDSIAGGIERIRDWAAERGLVAEGEAGTGDLVDRLRENAENLSATALQGALTAVEVLAGLALLLVFTFFLVKDGAWIWRRLLGLLGPGSRPAAEELGGRLWHTLGAFVRGLVVVAAFDAVCIALALWAIGVPLVVPLAVLTFLTAFVPVLGAFVAGAASALVALVALGVQEALLVIAATVAVQQLEGNVLHPLVMGRALALHPIVILAAVGVGGVLGGVLGAALATPLTAAAVTAAAFVRETRASRPPAPDEGRHRPTAAAAPG